MLEGSDIANQKWRSNTTALNVERGREREISNRISIVFKGKCHSHCGAVVGARESRIKWIFAFFDGHSIIFLKKTLERHIILYIFGI